jgi:TfoX/Sxy family transcriptional regulator of competence genes
MAYDETLATRIRQQIRQLPDTSERKMFGGICFMTGGNMFAGIVGEQLMARLPKEDYEAALSRPGARPMDFTGRPMAGFIYVHRAGIESDADLALWLDQCYTYAASLPAKQPAARKAARVKKRP